MTKKKRELIEILFDNVKPEDWPENLPYAAQDKDCVVNFYSLSPILFKNDYEFRMNSTKGKYKKFKTLDACRYWSKIIVHRDEFMKRWNDRNSVVDSEGWIQWNGGEMPVEKGTLIDVKYRGESENIGVSSWVFGCQLGSNKTMNAYNWEHKGQSGDIIAYRLHVPQEQKTPQQLALEKFGTDWHENDGETPLFPVVVKIDIEFKNGTIRTGRDSNESSFDIPFYGYEGFTVTRWRIHSDEKEPQIDKAAKALSEGIEKLNSVLPTAQQAVDGFKKAVEAMSGADIESIISERGSNYGRFEDGAEIMQQLKHIAHTSSGWERMKPNQREAMDMILHKIGRILNGNPNYVDSWIDIEGYSKLISDWLKGESK